MQRSSKWIRQTVADDSYDLLNLDHPEVQEKVIQEMEQGVKVYYDRRWSLTDEFSRWLIEHRELMTNKRVLILGAGVGWETLVVGRQARHVYLNDLAPLSLELCEEQMRQNGIESFTTLAGTYETIPLPEVDLAVGCFLVYNRETRTAMQAFASRFLGPLLLVNESLTDFRRCLANIPRQSTTLFEKEGAQGLLLHGVTAP